MSRRLCRCANSWGKWGAWPRVRVMRLLSRLLDVLGREGPGPAVALNLRLRLPRSALPECKRMLEDAGYSVQFDPIQEVSPGEVAIALHQTLPLTGRSARVVFDKRVLELLQTLRTRPDDLHPVSFSYRVLSGLEWRAVTTLDNQLQEAVLIPLQQDQGKTLAESASRLGVPQEQLKLRRYWSWSLRSREARQPLAIFAVLTFLVALALTSPHVPPALTRAMLILLALALDVVGLGWLVKGQTARAAFTQIAGLLALMTTIAYSTTRHVYFVYYETFQVAPEELGLDYRMVLSNQLVFVMVVLALALLGALLLIGVVRSIWVFLPDNTTLLRAAAAGMIGFLVLTLELVVPLASLERSAGQQAEHVRQGGSPTARGGFFGWPDPPRVRLANLAPAAYAATIASADLRLLGGDGSSWSVYDAVSGSTLRLPKSSTALVIAPSGTDRMLTLTNVGFTPTAITVPGRVPVRISLFNETNGRCTLFASGTKSSVNGRLTTLDVTVSGKHPLDVHASCAGTTASNYTLVVTPGQE